VSVYLCACKLGCSTPGSAASYPLIVSRDASWQACAWAGFVCVLLAANGLVHDLSDQALIFFGGALFLFLWAAWLARARH
jgi:hypothetical protein